jgi:serine protease Do
MVVAQLKSMAALIAPGWAYRSPVTAEIADSLGQKKAEGAIVAQPQADPASKAGIVAGDVITEIDGASIKDSRELARKVGMMAPGTKVKVTLVRKGEIKTLALTLGKMPNEQQAKAETNDNTSAGDTPRLGLNLAPAKDVAGSGDQGVAVVGVDPNGPAAERGIKTRRDPRCRRQGGRKSAEVRKALSDARTAGKNTVLLRVKTAEGMVRCAANQKRPEEKLFARG